jgi:Big-like domain-containing protein
MHDRPSHTRDEGARAAVVIVMHTATNAKTGFLGSVTRFVPAIASTMAALTTVFSFLYSTGVIRGRHTPGGLKAGWIALNPLTDTAYSLGDTIHLAATITDNSGAVLLGATPTWTSETPSVAKVEPDGTVITKTPGATTIIAAVDGRTARARIFVKQRIVVVRPGADSTVAVPEGDSRLANVQAFDARNHIVRGRSIRWTSDDTSVAVVDTAGNVTGRNLGKTLVRAVVDDMTTAVAVKVYATPAAVEAMDGGSQRALAGTALAQQVVVRVLSHKGRPVEGATVTFHSADGMGAADPATAVSDNQGRARTHWTLGDLPGVQKLLASVDGADSSATLIAEADPVASNTKVMAIQERVTAGVGTAVADPVGVRVTDAMGRLLSGVPVTWSALDGGAADGLTTRTDSAGEARARWLLGGRAGTQHLRVQVGSGRSVPPLTLLATALAGAPRAVTIASGDRQAGRVGQELPKSIVLRVVDSAGNAVADAPLTLSLSGGSVVDSTVRSDSTGKVVLHWTLGHEVGNATLSARITGHERASPAVVNAKVGPGAAETLTLDTATPKGKTHVHERVVIATVKDVYGNPVPDATLRFTTKTGSVSPTSAVSDAKGHVKATWKLSPKASEHTLNAAIRGSDVRETITVEGLRK